jgi:hypothetical protein
MDNTSKQLFYCGELSGVPLSFSFRYPETARYLASAGLVPADPVPAPVSVSQQEFDDWAAAGNRIDGFAEFCLLCQQVSQHLFASDRCVFHAAALRWRDRAWLIAGGSGVGKSTQCRTLLELWPDEFQVINGDKPILECREDGSVMVHPSPWNGKEGLHGADPAPLAGIFFLRRGDNNSVMKIPGKAAAPHALLCVFQDFHDADVIKQAGAVTQRILNSCPSWLLTSRDIPDTARLLYLTMQEVSENGL